MKSGMARYRGAGRMPSMLLMVLLFVVTPLLPAFAHPGVGIVRDRQGNVFYTDLTHVWRITPAGRKSIVVRDVHTHELAIDSLGNVYGEDSRYLGSGEGDDRWRHRIWRLGPDGRVTEIQPWKIGFWREYGFVRDRAGTMYWTQCPERRCSIHARTTNDSATRVVAGPGTFTNPINWMSASATEPGILYIIDGSALRRLDSAGRMTTVAPDIGKQLMGIWPTAEGDVYVASYGTRAVVRVRIADGRVNTAARSSAPWAPSGVLVAPDGYLWVLEYSTKNEARVRRIAPNGRTRVF